MSALEEFYRFCYEHGGTLKAHKDFAYLHLKVAAEFTELLTKIDHYKEVEVAYQLAIAEAVAATRERNELRAELNKRPILIMTEAEYKEYLAEQDRIKRQEEEQR